MLTRDGLLFRLGFHSSRGAVRGDRGAPRQGSTHGAGGCSRPQERAQEMLAVGMNAARLRHKEVIEAFPICLSSDICFLQALRAACQRMRYGPASLPGSARGRPGPIPTATFDTATAVSACVGRGNCSHGKGK